MKKGFTLIELLAVIVILAIIALIATPIILNIINESKNSADERSIDLYGKAAEQAVARYQLTHNDLPTFNDLNIEYEGSTVECGTKIINNDGTVYLADCSVGGASNEHTYGVDKRPPYTLITDSSICSGHQAFEIGKENFCIMYEDSTTITGLAEKNITLSITNPEQSDSAGTLAFSDSTNRNYWYSNGFKSEYPLKTGDTYRYIYDSHSNLHQYVEKYKEILTGLGANVQDARLASWEEMNAIKVANNNTMPSWAYSSDQGYWLGSANVTSYVWTVSFVGRLITNNYSNASDCGVRPLITISKS